MTGGGVITGPTYRITVLTSRLVRLEFDPAGVFEDRATQVVVNREFPAPEYRVAESAAGLEIATEWLTVSYDRGPFTPGGLSVRVRSESAGVYCVWHYGDAVTEGLWGTRQDLDNADGAVPLEPGVLSRVGGFGVIDDSASVVLRADGSVEERRNGVRDLYVFGYGLAYDECLRDFFHLTGAPPLVPRHALGNWWSRFHAYTAEEYLALMDRFAAEAVPLTVAVVDMDWHITDVDPRYGKGWTGYTWNPALFPDPAAFLAALHDRGLKVTLNLHPAEGIQPHEQAYGAMARAVGQDPAAGRAVPFDFADPGYVAAYFDEVLHPLEDQGVDFWWIDWQQGGPARPGAGDPLWLLNHHHTLDAGRRGERPLILSRYAGPGGHRYPIGFSGDTVIGWASLAYQPYFTATAANAGFGWWSHDIGGHLRGAKDDELMVRWVQFGVFSPVLRLHSTSNLFNGKEPWKYAAPARDILVRYLQLRHQLIPYLDTMNHRAAGLLPGVSTPGRFASLAQPPGEGSMSTAGPPSGEQGVALVRPMYHLYPRVAEAYDVPNQYAFGSEFMVCPITSRMDPATRLAAVGAWLPPGEWVDMIGGLRYRGGRRCTLYRPIGQIPVLAPPGAIVPLTRLDEAVRGGVVAPEHVELRVVGGADGRFRLVEDDGVSVAPVVFGTMYEATWDRNGDTVLTIRPESPDNVAGIPARRQYDVWVVGVQDAAVVVSTDGRELAVEQWYEPGVAAIVVSLPYLAVTAPVTVRFPGGLKVAANDVERRVYEVLDAAQIGYDLKESVYQAVGTHAPGPALAEVQALGAPPALVGAISEILFA